MDKILTALKCVNCQSTLNSPIILPCGHSICNKHLNSADEIISCGKCGADYSKASNGFPRVEALTMIVDSDIESMDFGENHKEAKLECANLCKIHDQIKLLLNDPSYFINETIGSLVNKIQLKYDELRLQLDNEFERIINRLSIYEADCKAYCSSKPYLADHDRWLSYLKGSEEELASWNETLNRMKIDESEWKVIKEECKDSIDFMNKEIKSIKKQLLLNKFELKEREIEHFLSKNLDFSHIIMESTIITKSEREKFAQLLGLSCSQMWELIYRASRDGFESSAFHSKCDGKVKTLTIVKTYYGSVFGGYTTCAWDQSERFKSGYDDFMFSFKNTANTPIKLTKKLSVCSSIYCSGSFGPIFGDAKGLDLKIADNPNKNQASFSNLGVSFPHPKFPRGSVEAMNFLAGSHNFSVSEIEVFQLN